MRLPTKLRAGTATLAIAALGLLLAAHAKTTAEGSLTFVASNLFSTANGTFHEWRVVSSSVDLEDPADSVVEVEVQLASVDTGIEDRDEHLRTADFFEVETHPTARVRVHSIARDGSDDQGRDRYTASFDLDLHGVAKTLAGTFSVVADAPLTVEGAVLVDRLDFGVGDPRSFWNPLSITEEIPVSFRAVLP